MSKVEASKLISRLPWRLGQRVDGYLNAVEAALDDIAKDLSISPGDIDKNKLFYILTIKSILDIINGQFWIMNNVLSISRAREIAGFRMGSETITEDSSEYRDAQLLRKEFTEILNEHSLSEVMQAPLSELVRVCAMK